MYTQCPDCGTVFRVTAEALRVAQGAVRCGICSTSFNALESLRDDVRSLLEGVPPEDTMTVEELPGNELIELSTPDPDTAPSAADILDAGDVTAGAPSPDESAAGRDLQATGDDDGADAGAGPESPIEEAALEFRGSAEDLAKVFVLHGAADQEAPARPPWQPPVEPAANDELQRAMDEASLADLSGIEVHEESLFREPGEDLDPTDEFPVLVLDEKATQEDRPYTEPHAAPQAGADATPPEPALAAAAATEPEVSAAEPRFVIPEELRRDLASSPPRAARVALEARDALGLPPDEEAEPARRWPWVAGAVLLLAAIGVQAVHFWRDDLVQDAVMGPWVLRAYDVLGLPLDPPADLAAFELRQWGATSDATQPGRLRLRASIFNRAVFAQPYPLLRLSLQDRFGNTIGVRDVGPADYLPGGAGATAQLLGPQQRADAEVVFVDPGRDAVGYELDLCLPAGEGVRCANAPATSP